MAIRSKCTWQLVLYVNVDGSSDRLQSDRMTIRSSVLYRIGINLTACCILDAHHTDTTKFKDMAEFLRGSRIAKALTNRTIVYESHVRRFWRSVRYVEDEKMIYSVVRKKDKNGQNIDVEIKFDVGDLRRVLELGDSDNDPIIVPEKLRKGLWYRMGFEGRVNGKYLKSLFSPPYKFLIHCIVHALSHRKGAYDETSDYIMNNITCLVLNTPYNVSQVL
ncbi:hypothetical protein Hanom_Chr13g01188951 [Helianthus anomalus]